MAGTKHSGGRNRQTARLHVMRGTFQPSRHEQPDSTPDVPPGIPDARDLRGEARAEFDRMVKRLQASGTLSSVLDSALRKYSQLHAQTEDIDAEHKRLGTLSRRLQKEARRLEGADLVNATREIVQLEKLRARQLQQLRQGSMALRQWLVEFGLTPAARTRVSRTPSAVPSSADPKKERYLRGLTTQR